MAFIVFEGIDGAGKSTLIQGLERHLSARKLQSVITREPGGTELGDDLREILLRKNKMAPNPKAELLIYMAIRAQHVEHKILPALQEKKWVLCDRYTYSSLAFQAGGRGLSSAEITWLNGYSTGGLQPDLWVLLDIETETSFARLQNRSEQGQDLDRFESEKSDFHRRVREKYLELAKNDKRCLVLEASQPKDILLNKLIEKLTSSKWL